PVAVDTLEKNLASPPRFGLTCPLGRRESRGCLAAIHEYFRPAIVMPPRIDADNDGLISKHTGAEADEVGRPDSAGVERNLVSAPVDALPDVIECPDATAPGQRHEAGATHRIEDSERI